MGRRSHMTETGSLWSLDDWEAWIDHVAHKSFGLTMMQFWASYRDGKLNSGHANDLAASVRFVLGARGKERLRK